MCARTLQPDGPVEQAPSVIRCQQVCAVPALTQGNQVTFGEGVEGGSCFSFNSKAQFAFQLTKKEKKNGCHVFGSAAVVWLG